jgi:SAM-dependent methyltransferase
MDSTISYEGRDIEALAEMPRYYDWIAGIFRPHVLGAVVEYGAGSGTISKRLLAQAETMELVEPSANLNRLLEQQFGADPKVMIVAETLETHIVKAANDRYRTVVMVNVLEHIEDDGAALAEIMRILQPGGRLLLFVPALPFLYSRIDEIYGHFRRYTRVSLLAALEGAGFAVRWRRYMDMLGVLPWFLVNTLGRKTSFDPSSVRLYDRFGVPLTKVCESVLAPPIGKNLIVIAEKVA